MLPKLMGGLDETATPCPSESPALIFIISTFILTSFDLFQFVSVYLCLPNLAHPESKSDTKQMPMVSYHRDDDLPCSYQSIPIEL
jgi:hypothetical protein